MTSRAGPAEPFAPRSEEARTTVTSAAPGLCRIRRDGAQGPPGNPPDRKSLVGRKAPVRRATACLVAGALSPRDRESRHSQKRSREFLDSSSFDCADVLLASPLARRHLSWVSPKSPATRRRVPSLETRRLRPHCAHFNTPTAAERLRGGTAWPSRTLESRNPRSRFVARLSLGGGGGGGGSLCSSNDRHFRLLHVARAADLHSARDP